MILILITSLTGSKPAITTLKDYDEQLKNNSDDITFDPHKLGIENVDPNVWGTE